MKFLLLVMFLGHVYGATFPKEFTCKVVQSAGSFSSFIQPAKNHTLNIDLENLDNWKDRIAFQEGSYISLSNMNGGKFSTLSIAPSSHDSGGIEISYEENGYRQLSLRIMGHPNSSKFTGWIIDDFQINADTKSSSMLSMSCLKL